MQQQLDVPDFPSYMDQQSAMVKALMLSRAEAVQRANQLEGEVARCKRHIEFYMAEYEKARVQNNKLLDHCKSLAGNMNEQAANSKVLSEQLDFARASQAGTTTELVATRRDIAALLDECNGARSVLTFLLRSSGLEGEGSAWIRERIKEAMRGLPDDESAMPAADACMSDSD